MKLPKNIKKLINEENRTKIIGLLTILVLLWLILYFIPEIFTSLFDTLLGNLILVITALLTLSYNVKYGIIVSIILIIIYRYTQLTKSKEGFTWNKQSTQDFLQIQNTINHNKIFDVDMIQKNQASQSEVNYFNTHGMWPWSERTIELYSMAVKSNPYIRTYSGDSINYARTLYNEAAILQIISYQTKEGNFLLNGVLVRDPSGNKMEDLPSGFGDFPYESGLIEHDKRFDVIKCNMKGPNGGTLERIKYTGKGGIYGEQTTKKTKVNYNDLEDIIPGFKFLDGPCNPCVAVGEKPNYSCPFQIKLKDKSPFISQVWQYLWNINDNPLQSMPSFLSENINQNEFPLLSELQSELNKSNQYKQQ